MHKTAATSIAALGVAVLVALPAAAHADPQGESFPVACDNGVTYDVVLNGNGAFTPAHDLDSNTLLLPTSFGEFMGVITDEGGAVIDEFTDPAIAKGSSEHTRATSASCTYTIVEVFEVPELGTLTFTGTGTVDGFITPVR